MSHLLRARFTEDIVAEFLPPKKMSHDVIVFCDGMPGMPGNKRLVEYYSKKGFWCVYPRYRGTWESGGIFLDHDPTDDIRDVIDGLFQPILSIWDGTIYNIKPTRIIVVGCSFGGPAALMLSSDPRVTAVIGVAAVVDWQVDSKEEPHELLYELTTKAFGEGYRMKQEDWKKLSSGTFYNPATKLDRIDNKKVLLLHAKDDTMVPYQSVETFATETGCRLKTLKKGGHLSSSILRQWRIYRQVKKHITR